MENNNQNIGRGVQVLAPFLLLFLALFTVLCQAQQTKAGLVGTVLDTSGAAIVGVTVEVTNLATGLKRETVTDATGTYSIPALPVGEYQVIASSNGFGKQQASNVTLQVEQTARIDFNLKVGQVKEAVEVVASGVALQTENATVGTVIDSAKITEMPLNGRNFIQLAQLIPGVQAGTPGSITVRRGRGSLGQTDSDYGSTAASANGARDTANRFYIDGIETMDYDAQTYAFAVSVDSLAEFKVQTSTYSADYGGAPGAQVNMLTKSGTNRFRGTLWEFNRNDALTDTYDAIAGQSVKTPRLNRNQYGANIGGPVHIPGLYDGRNKTFFFFNWEKGTQILGASIGSQTVPTAQQRTGNLIDLVTANAAHTSIALRDPLGVGIVNNVIPAAALSAPAQAFLAFESLPNHDPTSNYFNNYQNTSMVGMNRQQNYTARVDHALTKHDQISGGYIFNDTFEAGNPYWGHDQRDNLGRTQNISIGWTHSFGGNLVNEARGGWSRFNEVETFGATNDPAFAVAQKMWPVGSPTAGFISQAPIDFGPPSISVGGADGSFGLFGSPKSIGPRNRKNSIMPFTDLLYWQKGKHFIKLGGEFDRRGVGFQQARAPRGVFNFDGSYTGSALADFLLGYVRSANVDNTHTNTDELNFWAAGYLNDDFKITPRLTLTTGLRYDYFQRPRQKDNRMALLTQKGMVVDTVVTPSTSPLPYGRSLIAPDRNNFGPRLGFAWQPEFVGNTVLRGGWGMYYVPEISNAYFQMAEGAQAITGGFVNGNQTVITGERSPRPDTFFNNPFAALTANPSNYPNLNSDDQNMRDSYIQQWNLNLQHSLPGNFLIDVGYVGSKGTRLIVTYPDMNQPYQVVNPATATSVNSRRPNQAFQRGVGGDKSNGSSNYHSLQVRIDRRMSNGLTMLTAYTYSKAMSGPGDIGGQIGGGGFIGSIQSVYDLSDDHSVAGFDLRHRFAQTVLYDIPFANGMRGVAKQVLDGWQLSSIVTLQGGFPAGLSYGLDTTGTGTASRMDVVPGKNANLASGDRSWQRWFNTSAFSIPEPGTWGDSNRTGAMRLPGMFNLDFSASRSFRIHEGKALQLRSEFFNLPNHFNPSPNAVGLNPRDQNFGKVGGGTHGNTQRIIQIGAKLNF